jgi:hypothetical protein
LAPSFCFARTAAASMNTVAHRTGYSIYIK